MLVAEGGKLGRTYTPDPRTETGGFYRSDHFSMAKQGVPAISFKPGLDLLNGGVARGKALSDAYTKDRYHQPADEWSAAWDLSSVTPDLTLLYNTGRALADSRAWPNWSSDSEFKAMRDKSAAERK
jgi:Zn-dependent M28 family amino/carboxypeptidase